MLALNNFKNGPPGAGHPGPFAQRRVKLHDVQAVEKIFTKLILANCLHDVPIGRRDQPHVDVQLFGAAHAKTFHPPKPQQLRLQRPAHVPNFIQENCPPIGFLHAPQLLLHRPGESAFLVPEQFAFQQRFGIAAQLMRT